MVNDLDDAITRDPALSTILKNPETLESALQALRDHALAANTLNRPVSIPSTSTSSDWRRISVDSSGSPKRHGGSAKNAVVADVDSLLRKLSREQKRTAQLNAQLTLLEHDLKKENERAARNERDVQDIRSQMSAATVARREADHMLTRTQDQLQVAKSQFDAAVKEIERAQREIDALDRERLEAEDSARRARERARELLLEMKIQDARRQGWEEGRKQGLEEGTRGGEMEGSRHGRRDGTREGRVKWELGHKRLQHSKAQQAKAGKAARKQAAAAATASATSAETQTQINPTDEEGDSDEELFVRAPEWMGEEHVRRPSSRTDPYGHRGSLVSNISDTGEPSPIRIRSPALDNGPLQRPETAQSRSSRLSSGRARTGSDPTTIGGKSTPASEFDLLQQPPGRPDILSPIAEAHSQIGSSPRPTITQTPRGSKKAFSTPRGGPQSNRSSGNTRTTSNPTSGSSFVAPPPHPEISVVTNTPPEARGHGQRSNAGSIRTVNSGYPGSDELIEPLGDPHELQHPYAMAGSDKGKNPIRPGLSSSTFIPPTMNYNHHMYPVHDVPSPDLSNFSGYGTAPADPTRPHPTPRRRGNSSPLPEAAMLPTPDSSNGVWQQTDPLVSPPEVQAPGGGLQRSNSWVGGFVRPASRGGNRPGSRTGGIMRSIGGSIKRGIQNITRPPSAQQRPPSAQATADKYIPPGRRNSISPQPPPAVQGLSDLAANWRKGPRTTPSPQHHFYGRQATIAAQNSQSPVGVIPNMSTLRAGSNTPQGIVPTDPKTRGILKPPPQREPEMAYIESSPSVDMSQMPSEVQNLVSGWKAEAAARGERMEDFYPTAEEKVLRDARAADRARRIQAGEPVSPVPHHAEKWEYVGEQPATVPPRSVADMMHELDESITTGSKNSSPHRSHVPPFDVMLPPGGPGVGLALGIGSGDVATLEREAEDYQWDARSQKLIQTPRASPFDIEIIPPATNPRNDGNGIMPPQQNESFLMATPRPPPQHISPQGSPGPPPPPKVLGTQYVWADARANTSVAPGSARMAPSQLPVDATEGGIVPATNRGVRLSMQPEQHAQGNSARSQVAPLPVVTAENLPQAWRNTQKTTQAVLPGTYEAADVPDGMQYPVVPKKPGKRKKGKKGVEDDGDMVVPPFDPSVNGVGSSPFSFGGPPGGGISSTGGVMPPSSPRHGGGFGFDRNGWGGQGLKPGLTNKSGAATPSHASHSGMSVAHNLPLIEIVGHSPENGASKFEGWQTGMTLSQPLPGGNPWTQKIVPSALPPASPGRSRVAGGFGTGGWGGPATPSGMGGGGGISSGGGVVPATGAPAANKKKKKREGGGGWGGS